MALYDDDTMDAGVSEMVLRAEERKKRIVAHRALNHADAEQWDLAFWQAQTAEDRLSALVALRRDVEAVEKARDGNHH